MENKETLEEAADNYGFQVPYNGTNDFYDMTKVKYFIAGAKWQQERMYSEEEVIAIVEKSRVTVVYSHHNNNDMSKLTFTDGETFDLSGPLRLEKRADGWYVLGENRMMAVNDVNEGNKYIEHTNYQLGLMKQSDNYNFINNK